MKTKLLIFILAFICAFTLSVSAQYGNDDASQTAYDDGWASGDNGGTGFNAWTVNTPANTGVFVATSANTDCNILTSGEAWALWADNGATGEAIRPFTASLKARDLLLLQMDNGSLNGNSSNGFSLRNSNDQVLFEFYFRGGQANYKVNDAANERDFTGLAWTNAGLDIRFSLTSSSAYSISVRPLSGTTVYTMTGILKTPGSGTQTVDNIRLFYYEQTGQTSGDVFFNNLRVFTPLGNALDFDGTDDYIVANPFTTQLDDISIEAWVYWKGATTGNQMIVLNGKSNATGYAIYLDVLNNNYISGLCGSVAGMSSTQALAVNQWQHVALVRESGTWKLYLNGNELAITLSGSSPIALSGDFTYIGSNHLGGDNFNGIIDEVRLWNVARSQNEIQANMYSYYNGDMTNLKAYYRFDQGNAGNNNTTLVNEVIDYSGNCNKGTLTNFALNGATSNWVSTTNNEAPILTTNAATNVYSVTTLNGNTFSEGESALTERGFAWATTDCPDLLDNKVVVSGAGTGAYSTTVGGFTVGTTYYYRAYATNTQGTSYGEVQSFSPAEYIPFGNALDFDGTDDYTVTAIAASAFSELTIQMWIKTSTNQENGIFQWATDAATGGPFIYIAQDNLNRLLVWFDGNYRFAPTINLNEWVNVALTYKSNSWTCYINGVSIGSAALSLGGAQATASNIYLGTGYHGNWNGQIDEIQIWNIERTQAEIQANMYSYYTGDMTNLKSYYRFDQGNAGNNNTTLVNEVIDYSGNCNKGTLTNFALNGATSNWVATTNNEAPILTTNAATNVYSVTTLNGNTFSEGESAITERGFVWATTDCPDLSDNKVVVSGAGTGTFSTTVGGFTVGNTYYYRAFATNAQGTSYGEVQSFSPTAFIPLGNALDFDGTDDYVDCGLVNMGGTFTLEGWVYINDISSQQVFFGEYYGGFLWWDGEKLRFEMRNSTNTDWLGNPQNGGSSPLLNQNTWYHVACSIGGSGTRMKIFVDGVLVSETNIINDVPYDVSENYTIGKWLDEDNRHLNGKIDEVRVWNVVRNQEEIQANMYSYYTGDMTNLLAYYRFDQANAGADNTGLVNEVIDYSGNCNKGTLTNFARNGATSNWVHPGNPEAPILTTNTAAYTSYSSAGLVGNVFSIGQSNITTRGFQIADDDCFTTNLRTVSENGDFGLTGTYTLVAYGLTNNTTYYYRAYATNPQGTSYAETRSFTTTNDMPPGTCLTFDGNDDYVTVPNTASIELTNTGTWEGWFYFNNTSNQAIFNKNTRYYENGYFINLYSNQLYFSQAISWDNFTQTSCPVGAVPTGQWTHIAITKDNSTVTIYLNGILTAQNSVHANNFIPNTSSLLLGASNDNVGNPYQFFNGKIDEVRIWNDARTQEEIISYMNRTIENPAGETNLVAYYRFDENGGTTASDSKGTNNGTLTNGPIWSDSEAFNVWTGATNTTWATGTNWSDGVPDATDNIHIQPVNSPVVAANLTINSIVVQETATFSQTAPNLLTVSNIFPMGTMSINGSEGADPGKVTVNGSLFVGSNGALNLLTPTNDNPGGSLITNGNILGTGNVNVLRYFTVSSTWQQFGVPMANQQTDLFTEGHYGGYYNANMYTYNEAFEFATPPANSNYSNWTDNNLDDYWLPAQPSGEGSPETMISGTGYLFYNTADLNVTFSSEIADLNTGNKDISLAYTSNDNENSVGNYYDGWNFIANPYPSAIDWTDITTPAITNLDATAYFWNGTTKNYAYYGGTPLWGTGQIHESEVSQYIPAMQGFWVHLSGLVSGNKITLDNTQRVHNSQALYKDNQEVEFEYVKLQAENNGLTDEMMIGYFDDATTEFDSKYDAYKRYAFNEIPMLYSLTNEPEFPMALNALPVENKGNVIKLGYQSTVSGTHNISLTETNLDIPVILKDKYLNIVTDLSSASYSFEFEAGEVRDRFELFTGTITDIDNQITINGVNVYPNPTNGLLTIEYLLSTEQGAFINIEISDIAGKKLLKFDNLTGHKSSIDLSNYSNGVYIVKIITDKGTFTEKILKQ